VRHGQRRRKNKLRDIVPVGHRIHAVAADFRKAKKPGRAGPVDRQPRPGQGRRPQRQNVQALSAVFQPLSVAGKHFGKRQQIVRQKNRLRLLQMRVAGHDGGDFLFGHADQLLLERIEQADQPVRLVAQVQPNIQRDLIVAAARGMQFCARVSGAPDQLFFNGHVNVFVGGVENKTTLFHIGPDAFQPADDRLRVCAGNDARISQHRRMGNRTFNVMTIQAAVNMKGAGKALHAGSRGFLKSSRPGFFCVSHDAPSFEMVYFFIIFLILSRRPLRRMKPMASFWL